MESQYKIEQRSNQGASTGYMDNRGTVYGYVEKLYQCAEPHSEENHKVRKIIEWISPSDLSSVPPRVREETVKGTCQWFLDSKQFRSWRKKETRHLWVSGKPGAGKSCLSSIVIEDLNNTRETCQVASLYLSYKQQPSVKDLIGNLASQLVSNFIESAELPSCVERLWNQENRKINRFEHPPATSQLEDLLSALATNDTFLVIDALDEFDSNQRDDFLARLKGIQSASVLITSRDPVAEGFQQTSISANHDDITKYIARAIESSKLKHLVVQAAEFREEIEQKITEKADGIFLLVRLYLNAIRSCPTRRKAIDMLEQLPQDRDELYENTLERIKQDQMAEWAITTIGWLVHAADTLNVEELRHALLIGGPVGQSLQSGDARFDHGNLLSKDDILACCCGLVETEVDSSGQTTVRFIHYSTQEFFDANREKLFPRFQSRISLACAKYLCLPRLDDFVVLRKRNPSTESVLGRDDADLEDFEPDGSDFQDFDPNPEDHGPEKSNAEIPAPENLYTDGTLCDGPYDYTEELREFQRLEAIRKKNPPKPFKFSDGTELNASLEYLKAYSDGKGVLKHLTGDLKHLLYPFVYYAGPYLNSHFLAAYDDEESRSIIEDQVYRLVQNMGSMCNYFVHMCPQELRIEDRSLVYEKIDFVAYIGSRKLFEHYLNIGDVDISEGSLPEHGRDWLELTVRSECSDVVEAIINSEDIVNLTSSDGHSLLQGAAQRGYSREVNEVVDKIRKHLRMLEDNENSKSWMTQVREWLTGDSRQPHLATNHFGDVNPIQLSDHIRLLSSSSKGDLEVVSDLLDKSHVVLATSVAEGDIISTTKSYLVKTSFFLAIENNHIQIVGKFLEHGIDVNSYDFWFGETPLHRACFNNYEEMVKLLLQNKARTDPVDDTAFPLWKCAKSLQVFQLLLEATKSDPSALTFAAGVFVDLIYWKDSPELVHFFLEAGLDPSIPDNGGKTGLSMAVLNEDVESTRTLLQYRAYPNKISKGRTLLDDAINTLEKNSKEYLKLDSGEADDDGWNADRKKVLEGQSQTIREIVELLKAHGAKTMEELKNDSKILQLLQAQGETIAQKLRINATEKAEDS